MLILKETKFIEAFYPFPPVFFVLHKALFPFQSAVFVVKRYQKEERTCFEVQLKHLHPVSSIWNERDSSSDGVLTVSVYMNPTGMAYSVKF